MQILNVNLPQGFNSLKFDRYNGDGDPYVHIDSFLTLFTGYHSQDHVFLNLFSHSPKWTTLERYSSLPDYPIQTFDQLMDAFLKRFQANIGRKVIIADLVYCK